MRVKKTGIDDRDEKVVFGEWEAYRGRKLRLDELMSCGVLTRDDVMSGNISLRLKRYLDGDGKVIPLDEFISLLDGYFKQLEDGELEVVSHGRIIKLRGKRACCLEGLCRYLGISVDMWHRYESGEGFEKYHQVCRFARTLIDEKIITGGLEGLYNSTFAKFYLENRSNIANENNGGGIFNITLNIVGDNSPTIKKEGKAIDVRAEVEE